MRNPTIASLLDLVIEDAGERDEVRNARKMVSCARHRRIWTESILRFISYLRDEALGGYVG